MDELISDADYNTLSEDPEECFAELETICHRSLTNLIGEHTPHEYDTLLRERYMHTIGAAAEEFGIEGISAHRRNTNFENDFRLFTLEVQGVVTRIRLRRRLVFRPFTVQLEANTKTKIKFHLGQLRASINEARITGERKAALLSQLQIFETDLEQRRSSFAKTGAVLCSIAAGLGGLASLGSDTPAAYSNAMQAVSSIMRLFGADKETEDNAARRLAPPLRALPAPSVSTRPLNAEGRTYSQQERDDEIPF